MSLYNYREGKIAIRMIAKFKKFVHALSVKHMRLHVFYKYTFLIYFILSVSYRKVKALHEAKKNVESKHGFPVDQLRHLLEQYLYIL